MRQLAFAAILCVIAATAYAQTPPPTPTGNAQVVEKKLAGATKTSFLKKCESDVKKACDASAAEKRLAGAAKTSFTKKCVGDAVGS